MKKLSKTYKKLGIAFTFPIKIKDAHGNETYFEAETGYWYRREYDEDDKVTYFEDSNGDWRRREYDKNGNQTYFENSNGYKEGTKCDSCSGKVIEVDGKKYKLMEL
jgi:hypothetical protein